MDTTEGRIVIAQVHEQLRRQILDGTLPPGTVLSQVQLAHKLGVSRTPLREALRLLQEERLVLATHNHRVRVANINIEELESLYASRIVLESLALAITIPRLAQSDLDALTQAVDAMYIARTQNEVATWEMGNKRFHELLAIHAGEYIRGTIRRSIDGSERYRRIKLRAIPRALEIAEAEHKAILAACHEGNSDAAVELLARHLASTALTAIAHIEPEHEPTAVRVALKLVIGKTGSNQANKHKRSFS